MARSHSKTYVDRKNLITAHGLKKADKLCAIYFVSHRFYYDTL